MIEKITPGNVIVTMFVGWFLYTMTFDYRRYRFSFLQPTFPATTRSRQIELAKLGKVYQYGEHLSKSMYE
ncbi:hypothetical protein WN51_11099 [Melipona quadrifasciata]|uniref:Uncharacterized protein n=1 Tax=Melipona quadrifasciata TaxID=166423 RepID=A0A0N0BHU3_9HYME|nr:hypothetical protein WN51_11099 [Melipona quadrifasciata]